MTTTTATSNMMSASWGDNLAVACGDADIISPTHLILFMMIIP